MQRPWLQLWRPGDAVWRAEGVLAGSLSGYHSQHIPTITTDDQGRAVIFAAPGVYLYRLPGQEGVPSDLLKMTREWLPDVGTVAVPAKASAVLPPSQQVGWFQRLKNSLAASRETLVLLGYVGLALLAIYLFYRLVRCLNARYTKATPTFKKVGRWWAFRLLARIALYGALLVVAVPALLGLLSLNVQDKADDCNAKPSSCTDSTTGLLQRNWSVPEHSRFAKPRIPCPFVGVWEQPFGSVKLKYTLNENGSYQMDGAAGRGIQPDAGHWVVQGKYMLWRSTVKLGQGSDINRIVSNNSVHLELVETNGIHSHFERVGELPQTRCEVAVGR